MKDSKGTAVSLPLRTMAISAVIVVSCALLSKFLFGFTYGILAVVIDTLLLWPAVWLIGWMAPGRSSTWVFATVIAGVFVLGQSAKISLMALPITFGDIVSGVQLIRVLHGAHLVFALAGCVVAVLLLAWALRFRKARWYALPALLAYIACLPLLAYGLASLAGPRSEGASSASVVGEHGSLTFVFADLAQGWRERWSSVDEAKIDALAAGHRGRESLGGDFRKRNVHLLLMEGLWDPLRLETYKFSRDPWDPRFRRLWEQGGRSTVLSPTFGGVTANAEFEALCGLPAYPDRVVFEDGLDNTVPCLPRMLRERGYLTVANHPYKAKFWSRDEAYPKVGFEQYNPSGAYRLDDMDGAFLNDRSMYFQTLDRLNKFDPQRPYFAYVVSLSSHFPYDRDRAKRPDLVTVSPQADLLQAYANAVAYSTAAMMDYIEAVRELDPDAIIVLFGDHAPVLGANPDPYVVSGLKGEAGAGRSGLVQMSSTPLLVIDGQKGAADMGQIPLYALPSRVLALLGPGAPKLPYAQVTGDARSRIFLGAFLARKNRGWDACTTDTPDCRKASKQLEQTKMLRKDLIQGKQQFLHAANQAWLAKPVAMQQNLPYGACKLGVQNWGPRTASSGKGFNVQPDGSNAIWLKVTEGRGTPILMIGEDEVRVTLAGNIASAGFDNPQFLTAPGEYPVKYRCEDEAGEVSVGTFVVTASP